MEFKNTKEKAINGLKSKSANVMVSYNFSDELGLKFKFGEINLVELIAQMTPDLPYTLIETFENNFYICDKKTKFTFANYVDPKNIQKIWDDNNKQMFIAAYPELKDMYLKSKTDISEANCSNCAKNGKTFQLLNELSYLDHSNRKNEFFSTIYGNIFYEKLKDHKPTPRPQNAPKTNDSTNPQGTIVKHNSSMPQVTNSLSTSDAPRESCVNCCLKHIASAITLFQEAKQGFPAHRWLAIGELSEASNEMLRDFPSIANEIREIRLQLMDDHSKIPVLMSLLEKIDRQFYPAMYAHERKQ